MVNLINQNAISTFKFRSGSVDVISQFIGEDKYGQHTWVVIWSTQDGELYKTRTVSRAGQLPPTHENAHRIAILSSYSGIRADPEVTPLTEQDKLDLKTRGFTEPKRVSETCDHWVYKKCASSVNPMFPIDLQLVEPKPQ